MNQMQHNDDATLDIDNTKKPRVAIVILNWNGKNFLKQFLPSVMASVYDNKIVIVADNASTDDSISFLQLQYPQIKILQNGSNMGFAKGYNIALKQVDADYFILLNSDVEVTSNWINPIISLMENDAAIAACQPKLLAYNNKTQFEYAGAAGGWIDNFGYPFMRGRIFDICEQDNGQYNTVQQCFWASGAAFFVKAKAFYLVGGFDEYFFAHQEEIDLCWRLQLAGYKIFVQPASVVYHVGGGTLPKGNSKKVFLNFRNNLIMLAKNLPLKIALWKIPFRFFLDGIAAWKNLFAGDIGYFVAVAKAHLHFIGWLFFTKKLATLNKDKNKKLAGWYYGSLLWQHFINKKKNFLEIVDNK